MDSPHGRRRLFGANEAGRTDAGVHAYCQTIHFDTASIREIKSWIEGGNALLPKDIRIILAKGVTNDFHSRFSAITRTYRYIIRNSSLPSALERNQNLWVKENVDLAAMKRAASYVLSEDHFCTFRVASCQYKASYRILPWIEVK